MADNIVRVVYARSAKNADDEAGNLGNLFQWAYESLRAIALMIFCGFVLHVTVSQAVSYDVLPVGIQLTASLIAFLMSLGLVAYRLTTFNPRLSLIRSYYNMKSLEHVYDSLETKRGMAADSSSRESEDLDSSMSEIMDYRLNNAKNRNKEVKKLYGFIDQSAYVVEFIVFMLVALALVFEFEILDIIHS